MQSLLTQDTISYPEKILKVKELRQADYWYANNSPIKAYVRYQLLNDQPLIEQHYYSLNGYCDTLYQQKLFPEATQCYQKLAHHITDKDQLGMVGYRKAMSEFHFKQQSEAITDFSTISDAFSGTDAGYRAAIKKADLLFLTKKNWEAGSIRAYRIIAERATSRETAEDVWRYRRCRCRCCRWYLFLYQQPADRTRNRDEGCPEGPGFGGRYAAEP